jgi:PAS domain S-box-containing protein
MRLQRFVPDRLRRKYAVKLFAISVLIVAAVVALGTIMAVQVSERVTEEQLQSIEANAELEANALGRWIQGEQQTLRILSGSINAHNRSRTRATLNGELTDQSTDLGAYHVVERATGETSYGTSERIVASTQRQLEGSELGVTNIYWGEDTAENRREFAFDGRNDLLTSWVYIDNGEPLVAIATPTADGDHVLVGEYRPSVRVRDSVDVVDDTNTVVLGGVSGFVVFDETSTSEFRRYKGQINTTEVGSRILAREDPNTVLRGSEIDSTEVRGYHSVSTPGIDWVVVKETPRATALALTNRVQRDLAGIIGIVILGFVLIGVIVEYGPIREIKQTARQAEAIARGDLDITVELTDRDDELGDLRRSFRNTLDYIDSIAKQSEALSRTEFDAPVLDEEIPGVLGESITAMETELERFITELETERSRYSTLIEQSNDGIVVIQDGQFVFANDRFVDIVGYDREQLLGTSFLDIVGPVDQDFILEMYENRSELSPDRQFEVRIETAAGEQRTVEVAGARIQHDGEQATLTNIRDITDRKRRERRLTVFNRVLRHNLRNSLQTIQAALHAVEADRDDPELVASAHGQVEDLLRTANTARRMEEAFEDLRMETLELGPLFESLQSRAARDYPAATITIPDDTATVEAPHMLRDALWELIENACEHAGESPRIEVRIDRHEEHAVVHISDDGPGIPEPEREILGSEEESELRHTSGLGLWFVYWTVEVSMGELSFTVEDGTTVSVTLPLATELD